MSKEFSTHLTVVDNALHYNSCKRFIWCCKFVQHFTNIDKTCSLSNMARQTKARQNTGQQREKGGFLASIREQSSLKCTFYTYYNTSANIEADSPVICTTCTSESLHFFNVMSSNLHQRERKMMSNMFFRNY